MPDKARIRATVQLLENPVHTAKKTEFLSGSTLIDVLEDQGAWLKVKASLSSAAIPGWVPREALAFPIPEIAVFPLIALDSRQVFYSVPSSLKLIDFQSWFTALGQPSWIPQSQWEQFGMEGQQNFIDGIRSAIEQRQAQWDSWVEGVSANGRQDDATIDEWLIALQGGKDVWSLRPEMIYADASQNKGHIGWVVDNDIVRWTGRVKRNNQEEKYKIWYEVSLYKGSKELKGWFKGDLLDPYIPTTEDNDPDVEKNKDTQFSLLQPTLRLPADKEITDAIEAKRNAYQYIDIVRALGKKMIHFNLCGEFCVAALAGVDVIPLLNEWKLVYPGAQGIMNKNSGTGLSDVKSMLKLFKVEFEDFVYAPSVSPSTPLRIQKKLKEGKMLYAGVGIYKNSGSTKNGKLCGGETSKDKITRHWVVLEDIVPVGVNNGWVRIYNPFRNREEIYSYRTFILSVGQFGICLWVKPPAQ